MMIAGTERSSSPEKAAGTITCAPVPGGMIVTCGGFLVIILFILYLLDSISNLPTDFVGPLPVNGVTMLGTIIGLVFTLGPVLSFLDGTRAIRLSDNGVIFYGRGFTEVVAWKDLSLLPLSHSGRLQTEFGRLRVRSRAAKMRQTGMLTITQVRAVVGDRRFPNESVSDGLLAILGIESRTKSRPSAELEAL